MWTRRRRFLVAMGGGLALALVPASVGAHDLSTSYSRIRVDGPRADIAFTISGIELHNGPVLDADADGEVTAVEVDAGLDRFVDAILEHYTVSIPDVGPVPARFDGWRFASESVLELAFVYQFDRNATDLHVRSTLDEITQADHQHLLEIGSGDDARQTILSRDYPEITIDYAMGIPWWVTGVEFAVLGIEHIVTGYDHLAFLAGVLMATAGLLALTKAVTAFTLGHSVTLVLATLGIVTLPPRLIESVIALSIAYVAAENFLGRKLVERWVLTFLFGLVHGFGFSSVLRELGLSPGRMALSLFSFNFGVEVGQLAFVVAVVPALFALGKTRWKEHVIAGLSIGVMSLGFYWFVQRAVFG